MEQGDLVGLLNEVKERLWKALQSSKDGIIELTIGADKVDKMLNLGKTSGDKTRLGFVDNKSTPSTHQTKFVKVIV
ncbi:unnamed protein product [Prunus armeniaca]